jgi:hypothetical protein
MTHEPLLLWSAYGTFLRNSGSHISSSLCDITACDSRIIGSIWTGQQAALLVFGVEESLPFSCVYDVCLVISIHGRIKGRKEGVDRLFNSRIVSDATKILPGYFPP